MSANRPLFVATLHRPAIIVGGIQQHIKVFKEYCGRGGITVSVVSPFQAPKWLLYPLFGVRKFLSGAWNARWYDYAHGWLVLHELKRRVNPEVPSVIYAQDPVSARAALMLESSGWQVQIVLAVHFNGSIADEWAGKGYIARGDRTYRAMVTRDEQVLRAVDRIIFVSEYACREAKLSIAGLDRRKLSVIPNSVYAPPVDDNASLLGDLISIGGFEPRKNQEFLLRVLAAARDRGQIYTLTLVGSGPLQQPLRRLAESLGVSEQVRFPGALPDAAPLISRHRAYVHAALMENLPIVIIEALAAGRPAFAVPVGGIPEIFRDRIEGRMWELHDPDGAAAALISVLGAPDVYAAMAKAARARYEAWFTPEATQPRLLAAVSTEIQESEYLTGPLEPCCKN